MKSPTTPQATALALSLIALLALPACGGAPETQEESGEALTYAQKVLLQNLGTGRCMMRLDGIMQLTTCDPADLRQRVVLKPTTVAGSIKTYTNGPNSYCVTRHGLGEALTNAFCPSLIQVISGSYQAHPSQHFAIDPISLTDFVLKNPPRTACATDGGSWAVTMESCDGSTRQQWRELPLR